jgi:hypothetical protein
MSWFGEPKDLIAIVIATLAVILSLVTVLIQKQQQQRDAYRQIYDVLMSPELHRGRWMIVDISKGRTQIPEPDTPEFFLIYRTLGVFDALAMYTRHRIVPRHLVLKVWRHPSWTCARARRRSAPATRTGSPGKTSGGYLITLKPGATTAELPKHRRPSNQPGAKPRIEPTDLLPAGRWVRHRCW